MKDLSGTTLSKVAINPLATGLDQAHQKTEQDTSRGGLVKS